MVLGSSPAPAEAPGKIQNEAATHSHTEACVRGIPPPQHKAAAEEEAEREEPSQNLPRTLPEPSQNQQLFTERQRQEEKNPSVCRGMLEEGGYGHQGAPHQGPHEFTPCRPLLEIVDVCIFLCVPGGGDVLCARSGGHGPDAVLKSQLDGARGQSRSAAAPSHLHLRPSYCVSFPATALASQLMPRIYCRSELCCLRTALLCRGSMKEAE